MKFMNREEAVVVTFSNFKGGTGKTTNCTMMAHALSEQGYKVLLCDKDPQANATTLYMKTKLANENGLHSVEVIELEKTLMAAVREADLSSIVTNIKPNLDLLPSYRDFTHYTDFLADTFSNKKERVSYFAELLKPLKSEYDFIFIDTPPTISIFTDAALYASDFFVLVLQTQEWSLSGAEVFVEYFNELSEEYQLPLDVVGVLPVIMKKGAITDLATLENANKLFGEENMFKNVITHMERLKRYNITGILNEDMHDRRVHEVYTAVANEFIARLSSELTPAKQGVED